MLVRLSDSIYVVFAIDVGILLFFVAGSAWSVLFPSRRIWPPPHEDSWQKHLTWFCLYCVFGLNAALLVLDWNSWILESNLRLIAGVPAALLGGLLTMWGVTTLGWANTSGLNRELISSGPYRLTRNPQYLGNIVFFTGMSIAANSLFLWIVHALLILIFAIAPVTEEPWLESQHGEAYREYRRDVPRFW